MSTNFDIYGIQEPAASATISSTIVDPVGVAPMNVLDRTQAFTVQVNWQINAPGIVALLVGSTFQADVYLEAFDNSATLQQTQTGIAEFHAGGISGPYTATVTFPANSATIPGAYRMVATVTHYPAGSAAPDQLAGFVDGPIVQFY